jgi:integrase
MPRSGQADGERYLPRIKLTDKFIRNVTAKGERRDEYMDSVVLQLMLRVASTHKRFYLLARFPGYDHPTRRLLGPFYDGDLSVLDEPDPDILDRPGAALTLAEARDKARIWLGLIARGRDPGAERKAAAVAIKTKESAQREAAKNVFERVASAWVARKCSGLKQELEIDRLVQNEFVSRWKGHPIGEITREDYRLCIREIAERAPMQAFNSLGHLRRLLAWASESGEFGGFVSPLKEVKPSSWIDARKEPRSRILSPEELRAVWEAATAMRYPWGDVIRLLILTGQRLREIADLSWDEVDMAGRLITIRAERMKGKAAHEVPLAPYALALLESLPRWSGPYVFSLTGGVRPVGGFNRAKAKLDALSGVTGSRLHDLRRTARSGFSALAGFEDTVREAVLDHKPSGIARVYNLHSYQSEKRDLLAAWETRLLNIVAEPAVTLQAAE